MLHILTHNILPVFAILALGFGMGRTGKASADEARTLNRIAFLVLQPALIFPLIASLDLAEIDLHAVGIYAICEIIAFLIGYATARFIFKREHLESYLLAMAVIFVNSLLYIWPISYLIYGEQAALPITAIVALDASITFAFFIISMELMAGTNETGGAFKRVTTNPVLIAILLGALMNAAAIPVPEPVLTAAKFIGAGAAPLTLFALGVILSGHPITPQPVTIAIASLKLFAFPLIVWFAISTLSPANAWQPLFVLNAAGPSGAMAFALAMLYNVRTDAIAPVIIWTSTLSLISLAYLA
jgi:malonate transporter